MRRKETNGWLARNAEQLRTLLQPEGRAPLAGKHGGRIWAVDKGTYRQKTWITTSGCLSQVSFKV
jgi:hypothetical protein